MALLEKCSIKDAFFLEREYVKILKERDKEVKAQKLARFEEKLDLAVQKGEARKQNTPKITYPDLPIAQKKQEILDALKKHQVIIVAGETGSGKTTQLPKICLEAGLGLRGWIGHTQPRRLAARTMADRIAQELESEVGKAVGFKVRFSDKTQPESYIKVMTDGILLTESQNDKLLLAYDCLIIDEAHERSLNIDFLLGYIKTLITKRSDLKIMITSATIDVERFCEYFNAPLISVSGRTYPVELHYLDETILEQEQDDPTAKVAYAVDLAYQQGPGDILIFQTGEKEIRELVDVLSHRNLPNTVLLPLFARQSAAEQQKIFQSSSKRKIIITTNVAETSITVPNIKFVIDPGLARVSRYSYKNKLQRLPIEPISQASANQRKGRCGRVGPGICYRLYSQDDYDTRSPFTEPEILRTNLAGVILKMLALGLPEIEDFPFIEPPDSRFIKDGFSLLERLDAVDNLKQITPIGRKLSEIPMEPKLSRIIVAANQYGALSEILIIVSALSIVDPREKDPQKKEAEEVHRQFNDPNSDFLSYVNLWNFIHQHKKTLSHNKFRHLCRQNKLSYLRVCEWFDVYAQLKEIVKELQFTCNTVKADYSLIHKSLLTGLIDAIGVKEDKKEYLGARNIKFYLHPGSILFKKSPRWLMTCEIVHTTKNYARTNAYIEPKWIEEVAAHLLKKQYFEPHFSPEEGRVVAFEKATLFGLEIFSKRKVSYETMAPGDARKIFIQEALVEQQSPVLYPFLKQNQQVIQQLDYTENKIRRKNYLIDETLIFEFYDKQLPEDIFSLKNLENYLKTSDARTLCFTAEEISPVPVQQDFATLYPDAYYVENQQFHLEYIYDLSAENDGVTLVVPLSVLPSVKEHDFSWLIPGWRAQKIEAACKALPKKIRLLLSPLPQAIAKAIEVVTPDKGNFITAFNQFLRDYTKTPIDNSIWVGVRLENYLHMHFKIVDGKKIVAQGNDLHTLFDSLKMTHANALVSEHAIEKKNIITWDFGSLPEKVDVTKGALQFSYYPALVDNQTTVEIQLFETKVLAQWHHTQGLARLYILQLADPIRNLKRNMNQALKKQLTKLYSDFGDIDQCLDEIAWAVVNTLLVLPAKTIISQENFEKNLNAHRTQFTGMANQALEWIITTLEKYQVISNQFEKFCAKSGPEAQPAIKDIQEQLTALFSKHFIKETPWPLMKRLPVYLEAIAQRLDKFPRQIARDKEYIAETAAIQKIYTQKLGLKENIPLESDAPLALFKWKIEELRVSHFAQALGSKEVVSKVRLLKMLEK